MWWDYAVVLLLVMLCCYVSIVSWVRIMLWDYYVGFCYVFFVRIILWDYCVGCYVMCYLLGSCCRLPDVLLLCVMLWDCAV